MKKNTEPSILKAFHEMMEVGLPIKEFIPHEKRNGSVSFDWKFSRDITKDEQKKAKRISSKYLDAIYSFRK